MKNRSKKTKDFLLISFLSLLPLSMFWGIISKGESLYGSDFVLFFYPVKKFIHDSLLTDRGLPLWNPFLFSGTPFVTNIQASMFYPLGFLYYIMPSEAAYVYSTLLHFVLGSLFMYLFMRSLHVHPLGGLFGALAFSFNGYFMGHLYAGHLSFVQNYIWIPLIFLCLNRFMANGSLSNAMAAGLLLGLQILGGFPQIAFYTVLAGSLFLCFGAVCNLNKGGKASRLKLSGGWLLFVLVEFSIAAVQILPTYEFTTLSTRGEGIGYAMATYESLHPKELLAFLIPDIFGSPLDGTYWPSQESWHFWESCGYIGILPLFLLFIKGRSPWGKRIELFFFLLLALSIFLALGKYNPLYPFIYRLPGFNSFRIPAQIIFLYVFSVAVLSGMGLGKILDGPWSLRRGFLPFTVLAGGLLLLGLFSLQFFPYRFFFFLFRNLSEGPVTHADLSLLYDRVGRSVSHSTLFFFISLFLILLVRAGKLRAWIFGGMVCAMVFSELYLFGAPFIRSHEFVTPAAKEHLLDQLPADPARGRVLAMDHGFRPNDGLMHRFPSVLGYDPLILKRYVDYILFSQGLPPHEHVVNLEGIRDPKAKLLRLLHVRDLVSHGRVDRMEGSLPYAYFVEKAVILNREEILSFMTGHEFDPAKVVVLEREHRREKIDWTRTGEPLNGSCDVVSYGNEEIRVQASLNRPAYLVMSEIYYPGWYASVNGRKVDLLRGNYLFRVLPLEAGRHDVRLYFVSWPFRIGAAVSLATLFLSLGFLLLRRRSPRTPDEDAKPYG